MKPQTAANKAGHERARGRGFVACGPTRHGWRGAKVECVKCGYQLPWYHELYQKRHRAKCGPI